MKITCPQCSTAYKIPTNKIGDTGRKVKCASCNHIWHVEPDGKEQPAAPSNTGPEVHNNSTTADNLKEPSSSQGFDDSDLSRATGNAERHSAFSEEDLAANPKEAPSDTDDFWGIHTSTQSTAKTGPSYEETAGPAGSEDKKPEEKNQI